MPGAGNGRRQVPSILPPSRPILRLRAGTRLGRGFAMVCLSTALRLPAMPRAATLGRLSGQARAAVGVARSAAAFAASNPAHGHLRTAIARRKRRPQRPYRHAMPAQARAMFICCLACRQVRQKRKGIFALPQPPGCPCLRRLKRGGAERCRHAAVCHLIECLSRAPTTRRARRATSAFATRKPHARCSDAQAMLPVAAALPAPAALTAKTCRAIAKYAINHAM